MILLLSHVNDDHATGVLDALRRMGHPVKLFDTSSFPTRSAVTQWFEGGVPQFLLVVGGERTDLRDCGVVWWRRPQPFTLDQALDHGTAPFAYSECHEAMAGLWASLPAAWVNPPWYDEQAHHKPFQLATAVRMGLPVPRTLITNDPAAARAFVDELGPERTVYKTFLAMEEHWRETRVLRDNELRLLPRVQLAPAIFQELIPYGTDIRVTVVGEELFATEIVRAPQAYAVDYRMDMESASWKQATLPVELEEQLRSFMTELHLVYGAIDLLRTAEGDHVFLEINPAGEWRFVEDRTGQPITSAMARLLASCDRVRQGRVRIG